jgi:uncharacterized protein (TIGR03083 family)
MMNLDDYLTELESNAVSIAAMATEAGADAAITTCPGWVMRDLVLHTGEVHRWAAAVVRGGVINPSKELAADYLGALPADDELVDWFVAGATALVATLRHADTGASYFTFLQDPPSPFMFWPRRQALETAMHRIDAESAIGRNTGIPTLLAADGIDEILTGFAPRKHTPLRSESPVVLQIAPTDSAAVWSVTISDQPVVTVRTGGNAQCTARGISSDLYQALWNRQGTENLTIDGDVTVLELFRDNVKIRWS